MRQLNEDIKSRLMNFFTRKKAEETAEDQPSEKSGNWSKPGEDAPVRGIDKVTASTFNQHHAEIIQAGNELEKIMNAHHAALKKWGEKHPSGAVGAYPSAIRSARASQTSLREVKTKRKYHKDQAYDHAVTAHGWERTPVPERPGYTRPSPRRGSPKQVSKPMGTTKV